MNTISTNYINQFTKLSLDGNSIFTQCLDAAEKALAIRKFTADHSKIENLFCRLVSIEARAHLNNAKARVRSCEFCTRSRAFTVIGRVDPLHDFTNAKEAARTDGFELYKVVEKSVSCNLSQARAIASSIKDPYYAARSLIEVEKKEEKPNLSAAKIAATKCTNVISRDEMLVEIIRQEGRYDLDAAKKTAQAMHVTSKRRVDALSIIAWYDPAHDFSSAIAEARCLSDNCSELLNLVETMARFDRDAARNLAYEIKNPFHKVLALIALANTDPAHDIQEALQQAQALEDIDSKVDVLIKICKIDPKHDFSYAKTALLGHNSEDDYETGSAWLSIVNAQIELGELAQAEETCELIPDDFHRAFAQANVVKALLKQNSNQQAFTLTQKISYSYFKMTALIRLAKKDPKIDLSECRTLLSGLRCEVDRATFLFKLAMIDSRYLEEAKQQIPHVRSSQYVKFIQAEASRDLAAAQKEALSVEEPLLRAEALLAVAALVLLNKTAFSCLEHKRHGRIFPNMP